MPTTPYGVRYPGPDEPVAEGAARIEDVAVALDGRVLAGELRWGPQGAPTDTRLYRSGPGIIQTDGGFRAVDAIYGMPAGGASAVAFATYVGPLGDAFRILGNGTIQWGDGTNPVDSSLYRAAAKILKSDSKIVSDAGIGGPFAQVPLGTYTGYAVPWYRPDGTFAGYLPLYSGNLTLEEITGELEGAEPA
jgi:hypothetical protein